MRIRWLDDQHSCLSLSMSAAEYQRLQRLVNRKKPGYTLETLSPQERLSLFIALAHGSSDQMTRGIAADLHSNMRSAFADYREYHAPLVYLAIQRGRTFRFGPVTIGKDSYDLSILSIVA